jgi:thiol-disulfide isomerase/thioredoxin
MNFAQYFDRAFSYNDFLNKYGTPEQRQRWGTMHARVKLKDAQRQLLKSFKREMKVLVMAGTWCGDCVDQCPIFDHFAALSSNIKLRFIDRDDSGGLNQELLVCGAPRVPQVVLLSEDDHFVSRLGDKTLAKYRALASSLDGQSCSSGLIGPGEELLAAVTQEWLNEFERVQLILRLSGRLREKHGD